MTEVDTPATDVTENTSPAPSSAPENDAEAPAEAAVEATSDAAESPGSTPPKRAGFLSNFGIGARIALIVALPLAAAAGLAGQTIVDGLAKLEDDKKVVSLTQISGYLANAIHHLQTERDLTAMFVATDGDEFGDRMKAQRAKTDAFLTSMDQKISTIDTTDASPQLVKMLSELPKTGGFLDAHRQKVDALKVKPAEATKIYSDTIAKDIAVVKAMVRGMRNGEAIRRIAPYIATIEAKEFASQERSAVISVILDMNFDIKQTQQFISLIAKQTTEFDVFHEAATDKVRKFASASLAGPAIAEFTKLRSLLIESAESGLFDGLSAAGWYTASSARIDLIRKLEDYVVKDLVAVSEKAYADAMTELIAVAAIIGAIISGVSLLAFFVVRGISRPVTRLTEITERLAEGELETEIDIAEGRDEIGRLVKQVKVFKDNLQAVSQMQKDQAETARTAFEAERRAEEEKRAADAKIAADRKRLEEEAAEKRRQDMLDLADSFESSVGGIIEAVSSAAADLQSSSQAMSTTAGQTSSQSSSAAAATEEASTNVQTVAAAAEELSSSIDEIGRQVSKSSDVAQSAVDRAQATNEKVQGLSVAAMKIGEVVDLINDIASQTNLLALNATIEAARAGEAGKGFAVVATEVKSLADQTAKATEDIGGQISEIQNATNEAVDTIGSITEVISEISEISSSIATAVEEQGASTREISSNVQQAAQGTQEVSSNMAEVTQAADQTGAAAVKVNTSADDLSVQATNLRASVDAFLTTVRAA
jgi:methyl-accepting chemotaxis protein